MVHSLFECLLSVSKRMNAPVDVIPRRLSNHWSVLLSAWA